MQFKPHDRVVIGGRTMLRPGYSLVGMTGTVFAVGGFVPSGHVQVMVDGEVVDDDGGSRVLIVNVPSAHLELLAGTPQEETAAPAEVPSTPAFTMVAKKSAKAPKDERVEAVEDEADKTAAPQAAEKEPDGDEPEKPFGLRLV